MKISKEDIRKVAVLARIELREEEIEKYAVQLQAVISYIEQLNELDTGGIEPTSYAIDSSFALRKDEPGPDLPAQREKLLQAAPEREGDFFKVKKIIE